MATHNIRRVLDQIESRVEIVAYLKDDTPREELEAALAEIRGASEVQEAIYVSRDEALQTARDRLPEFRSVFADLDVNPLPASIELRLRPGHRTPDVVEKVASRLGRYTFVEETSYGRDWVEQIYLLRRIAGAAALVVGGAFAAVAALIIGTAVRMAIYARREEIEIMRLVGATDGFIQRPFLLEGLLTGLLGGGLALSLTYTTFKVLSRTVFRLSWLPQHWVLAGIATGGVLGLLASAAAVRRHLRSL
jgi:cell division transport system permease protein